MILLKMQGVAPHPDLALLPGPGESPRPAPLRAGPPRDAKPSPCVGGRPALARRAGRQGAAQLTVNAQSARQRVPGPWRRHGLQLGRNPTASTARSRGTATGRQVREHRATASSQLAPKRTRWTKPTRDPSDPHDPGGGRHDVGPHRPPGPVTVPFAQQRLCAPSLASGQSSRNPPITTSGACARPTGPA